MTKWLAWDSRDNITCKLAKMQVGEILSEEAIFYAGLFSRDFYTSLILRKYEKSQKNSWKCQYVL